MSTHPLFDYSIDQREARHLQFAVNHHERRGGFLELRWKTIGGTGMQQAFYPTSEREAINAAIDRLAPKADVYFGVLRREREAGTKDACAPSRVAWVEVDDRDAIERIMNYDYLPNFIVESSPGKYHAYFDLADELDPRFQRQMNMRLAAHFGGDTNATDSARILRPAGTLNHKYGDPVPVQCVYIGIHEKIPTARELVGDLPDPEPRRAEVRELRPNIDRGDDPLRRVPASEYIPALTGRPVYAGGKVQCPFHKGGNERTPSLHAYDDPADGYYCWGCDDGGDVFTFGARLYGLDSQRDFPEIRRRLTADLLKAVAA